MRFIAAASVVQLVAAGGGARGRPGRPRRCGAPAAPAARRGAPTSRRPMAMAATRKATAMAQRWRRWCPPRVLRTCWLLLDEGLGDLDGAQPVVDGHGRCTSAAGPASRARSTTQPSCPRRSAASSLGGKARAERVPGGRRRATPSAGGPASWKRLAWSSRVRASRSPACCQALPMEPARVWPSSRWSCRMSSAERSSSRRTSSVSITASDGDGEQGQGQGDLARELHGPRNGRGRPETPREPVTDGAVARP